MPSAVIASVPPLAASLIGVAALFGLCIVALVTLRVRAFGALIYLASAAACTTLLISGATHLLRSDAPEAPPSMCLCRPSGPRRWCFHWACPG